MQYAHTPFNLHGFVALLNLIGVDSPINSAISVDIWMYHFTKKKKKKLIKVEREKNDYSRVENRWTTQ